VLKIGIYKLLNKCITLHQVAYIQNLFKYYLPLKITFRSEENFKTAIFLSVALVLEELKHVNWDRDIVNKIYYINRQARILYSFFLSLCTSHEKFKHTVRKVVSDL
jgi:hypothetical protein